MQSEKKYPSQNPRQCCCLANRGEKIQEICITQVRQISTIKRNQTTGRMKGLIYRRKSERGFCN